MYLYIVDILMPAFFPRLWVPWGWNSIFTSLLSHYLEHDNCSVNTYNEWRDGWMDASYQPLESDLE